MVAASFVIVTLSLYEHTHSIRPTTVLEIYLFLTLLFDIIRTRTLWLIDAGHTGAVVFTSSLVLKAVVLGLEVHGKRGSWINPEDYLRSREETSGAFGQAFLSWLIHLINTGYRKDLALPDLYPLPHEMQSENVGARFDLHCTRRESYPLQCRLFCTTIMLIQLLAPQRTTKDLVFSLFWSLW